MQLRYYLYISDPKVDMLLSQIDPSAKRKLAREFSLNLKVFSAKRSSETLEGEDRVRRLEAVVKYLGDHDEIRDVDDPGRFFAGDLDMRWGPYSDSSGSGTSGLVYFGGTTERVIVGLGGSSSRVLGAASSQQPIFSHSATPALIAALTREFDDGLGSHQARSDSAAAADELALRAVHLATSSLSGPAQRLEFVAKRLLGGPSPFPQRDPHDEMLVLLGSPLYVAMVE